MKRIGLLGEDPNDTTSIKNLLQKKYKNKAIFLPITNGVKGFQLDTPKVKATLKIEFASRKCEFVIYIRDLDGFKSQKQKVKEKEIWFKDLDATVNNKGVLLLNIWELEGLIMADISTFNKLYKTKHNFKGDPMMQKEPKEILKRLTSSSRKKYKESDCPEIFDKLNILTVEKNCSYFKEFILT
jgi:hypothetical protein